MYSSVQWPKEVPISPNRLTIIITTSPTPSSPSTELIESVLNSLPSSLDLVPMIVVFDAFKISAATDNVGRLKRGQVPAEIASTYAEYFENVRKLFECSKNPEYECEEFHGSSTSHGRSVTFLRSKSRLGFAYAVKSALTICNTLNILVLQHDWIFVNLHPPFSTLLRILSEEEEVNYITFCSRQSQRYEHTRGESHPRYKAVFDFARQLRVGRPLGSEIVACLHFFDRPHLCSKALYEKIFQTGLVKKGNFVEDTFGTNYMSGIAQAESSAASVTLWSEYGTWMLAMKNGMEVSVRHLAGRTNLCASDQAIQIREYIKQNIEKAH